MKIADRVFQYSRSATFYAIDGGSEVCLIDCGSEKQVDWLLGEVEKDGLTASKITRMIVTHAHGDHVGGVGILKDKTSCAVMAHRLAVEPIETGDPVVTGAAMPYADHQSTFHKCSVDSVLEDGDTVHIGGVNLEVIHTPGHTPGSIALRLADYLFVGDTVFANGGVGWIDIHWGSNVEDYLASLRLIKEMKPKMILPSHGDPFEYADDILDSAIQAVEFYMWPWHGLGLPRARRTFSPRPRNP